MLFERRNGKVNIILAVFALAMALAGCQHTETEDTIKAMEESQMQTEEAAVLAAYEKMQQAMIDKDLDALRSSITEDKTFTHMSGKTQTREGFFGEILNGTLNYYKSELHDPVVTVDGDTATLTGSTALTAKVYGISGSWTLPTNAHFVKIEGQWVQCN